MTTKKHTPIFSSKSGVISLQEVERILMTASEIADELKDSSEAVLREAFVDGKLDGKAISEAALISLRSALYGYWAYLKMSPLTEEDKTFGDSDEKSEQ